MPPTNLGKVTRFRRSEPRAEVSLDPLMLDVDEPPQLAPIDWRIVLVLCLGWLLGFFLIGFVAWFMYQLVLLVDWIVRSGL